MVSDQVSGDLLPDGPGREFSDAVGDRYPVVATARMLEQ